MFSIKKVYTPTIIEAIILAICIVGLISGGIIKFSAAPHIPILLTIFLLILYGLIRKVPFKKLEEGMTNGAKSGISAIFIFFF